MPASSCTSNDSVPSSPTLVDTSTSPGPVGSCARGLVVDLELVAAGRERADRRAVPARQADLEPGPDAALRRGAASTVSVSIVVVSVLALGLVVPTRTRPRRDAHGKALPARSGSVASVPPSMARPHDTRLAPPHGFEPSSLDTDRRVDVVEITRLWRWTGVPVEGAGRLGLPRDEGRRRLVDPLVHRRIRSVSGASAAGGGPAGARPRDRVLAHAKRGGGARGAVPGTSVGAPRGSCHRPPRERDPGRVPTRRPPPRRVEVHPDRTSDRGPCSGSPGDERSCQGTSSSGTARAGSACARVVATTGKGTPSSRFASTPARARRRAGLVSHGEPVLDGARDALAAALAV